jgi:hypothetical protein
MPKMTGREIFFYLPMQTVDGSKCGEKHAKGRGINVSGAHGKKKNWVSSVQVYLLRVDITMF